jgi:FMN phosphatase YigB (HAD superfamily)
MKPKLLIFDLDDCLVDTWGALLPTITNQAVKAMMNAGLKVSSYEKAAVRLEEINAKSKNGTEAITTFLQELNADPKFLDVGKKSFYNFDFDYNIKPLPGVMEMLNETNADFALVTKGEHTAQMEKLRKAGISQSYFKKIMAVPNYNKGEYYQETLKELGYSTEDCFVCGDRYKTDLLPAKKLGIKTICVHWGRGKINPPPEGEVDFMVNDLRKVKEIINNENRNKKNTTNI